MPAKISQANTDKKNETKIHIKMITFKDLHQFGRFGNRLFMIAGTIGIAIARGFRFGFPAWEEQKYFKNPLPVWSETYKNIPEYKMYRYTYSVPFDYQPIYPPDGAILFGFMQTEKYFKHCGELIRDYFEFIDMPYLPDIAPNSIAIHYRGTDYDGVHYPRCNFNYYIRALDKMPSGHKLYVFSDDIEVAKEMFQFFDATYVQTGHYISDFVSMMKCRHFIISNSTYAWWAAWLAKSKEKIVIAPRTWYGPAFKHNVDDIYSEKWIVV